MTTSASHAASEWQQHLDRAEANGTSLAAYAKTHSLNIHTLYYWRSKLRKGSDGNTVVSAPTPFATVRMPASATTPCILYLPAQVSLQFATLPDSLWLADLCRQLERRP